MKSKSVIEGASATAPVNTYQTLQHALDENKFKAKRNDQQLRAAEMILNIKNQNAKSPQIGLGSTADLAGRIYNDEMIGDQTLFRNSRSPFASRSRIPNDWEGSPLNDRVHYNRSPAVKHSNQKGDFSPERYRTRTFNRKLKMADSFTRILPGYDHVPSSCYTYAASHVLHPEYMKSIEDMPIT